MTVVGQLTALIGTLDFLMTVLVSIFDCPSNYFWLILALTVPSLVYTWHLHGLYSNSSVEFITTIRGARFLIHQEYNYTLNQRTAHGQTRWCQDRTCPGREMSQMLMTSLFLVTATWWNCNYYSSFSITNCIYKLSIIHKKISVSNLDEMRHVLILLDEMGTNLYRMATM